MERPFTIDEIKNMAVPIAKMHGVTKLALFGSYAKAAATPSSDLDFLINGEGGLLDLVELIEDLERQFGIHVDVVDFDALEGSIVEGVDKGAVTLYE